MKMSDQPHNEDWKQEAPELASLPPKEPFEVPQGYFDQFPDRMMAAIESEQARKGQNPRSFARWWMLGASAAAIAAILLITLWPATAGQEGLQGPWVQAIEPDIPALTNAELAMAIDREAVAVEEIYGATAEKSGKPSPPPGAVENLIEKDIQELPTQEMEEYLQDLPLDELESLL